MPRRMSCAQTRWRFRATESADPTVLQTRAVYQFGGSVGPDVAAANDSDNIAEITGLSACIVGREWFDHVEYRGSVAPDDYQ